MAFTKTGDKTKAQILAGYADTNKVQWNKNLNFHALKAILTASEFIPSVSGDWATAPTTVDAALNELGARTDEFLTDAANADKVLTYATTTGAPTIAQIENKQIAAGAAIATSKLAAATQIGYLSLGGTITTGGAWTQTGAHTVGITTTGNTTVTLPQTGTLATLGGAETFSGAKTFTVKAVIDNDVGVDFRELTANGTNKVLLKGPSDCLNADKTVVLPNHSCTLPAADGTSGQMIQTNGSGVWSFATVAFKLATFTVDHSAITLGTPLLVGTAMPAGSIVVAGGVQITEAFVGSVDSTATMKFGLEDADNDLVVAAAVSGAPWSSQGFKTFTGTEGAALAINTPATGWYKQTVGKQLTVTTVANNDATLTAGTAIVHILYI